MSGATPPSGPRENPFIGEWKDIPEKNFLCSLEPGRYFLQNNRVLAKRLQEKLAKVLANRLKPKSDVKSKSTGDREAHSSSDKKAASGSSSSVTEDLVFKKPFSKQDDLESSLLELIDQLTRELNRKLEHLVGVRGGGNDKMLDEIYNSLDSLLATAYHNYVQVQPTYFRENNLQHLMIDIELARGLRYEREKRKKTTVSTSSRKENTANEPTSTSETVSDKKGQEEERSSRTGILKRVNPRDPRLRAQVETDVGMPPQKIFKNNNCLEGVRKNPEPENEAV